MRSDREKQKLIEEFPELQAADIIFEKEVFAHFGLAFMKFGLVEHSLINILTFDNAAQGMIAKTIRDRTGWENAVDQGFENAVTLTFGNMVKKVVAIPEFRDLASAFSDAKCLRDYFAHHFMREEARYLASEEGCWLLLSKIADVRHKFLSLDESLKSRFEEMCRRLKIPLPREDQIDAELTNYRDETDAMLVARSAKVGWEK